MKKEEERMEHCNEIGGKEKQQQQQHRRRQRRTKKLSEIGLEDGGDETLIPPTEVRKNIKILMLKAIDDTADAIKQIPRRSSTAAAETKKQPRQKEKPQKSSRQLKQKLYSTAIVPTCSQRQPRQQCLRQCDGPCKTSLDVRHLTFFDICEHVACEQCLENAPRIEASIGGSGCPNLKCFLLDLASLCPGKKRCMATTRRECNLKECSRTSSAIESPSLNSSKKYTVTVTMSVKTTKK